MLIEYSATDIAQAVASKPATQYVASAQEPAHPQVRALLKALSTKAPKVLTLLGPKMAFTLGANGMPIGRTAYSEETMRAIESLVDYSEIVITPAFEEIGDQIRLGAEYHASYVVGASAAVVCTSTPSTKQNIKPWCLALPNESYAIGLRALHEFDYFYSEPDAKKAARLKLAASTTVFTPQNNQKLMALLGTPGLKISTGEITDSATLAAISKNGSTHELHLSPKVDLRAKWVQQLIKAGVKVRTADRDHGGTIVVSKDVAYVGSVRLQPIHLKTTRDVGVVVPVSLLGDFAKALKTRAAP